MNRPFAESAEQNKQVIAEVVSKLFVDPGVVLEIGAGTGQHARYFSSLFSHLHWWPSEVPEQMPILEQGVCDTGIENLANPIPLSIELDHNSVNTARVERSFDYLFTANTLHIMSWDLVVRLIQLASELLDEGGIFLSYGPYNVQGKFTSDSNARFDQWLKQRDAVSGIRDIDELRQEGKFVGLDIDDIIEMPANNKILVWRKI